jgi:hypothetical protein
MGSATKNCQRYISGERAEASIDDLDSEVVDSGALKVTELKTLYSSARRP